MEFFWGGVSICRENTITPSRTSTPHEPSHARHEHRLTSVASAIITQRVDLAAQLGELDQADWCISAITRAELQFGIRRKPAATRLARLVAAFLAAARTEPFDGRAADECRRVRAELDRLGIGIGVADELIAAHALSPGRRSRHRQPAAI
mgnify:FL=1